MLEPQRSSKTVTGLLRRRRLWIVATVAACVAVADLIALLTPPTYEASALLVIDQRATSPSADLNATLNTGQLLAAHFIKVATTQTVLDRVCADAGGSCTYDSLKNRVTASTVKGTDLLQVTVADSSPSQAANLANLVTNELMGEERREVAAALKPTMSYLDGELSRLAKALGSAHPEYVAALQAQYTDAYTRREAASEQETRLDGGLSVVEAAAVPAKPAYSRVKLYLIAGLAVGLVAALVVALIVERLDSRIFERETLSDATAAPLVLTC